MSEHAGHATVQQVSVEAVVTRCRCTPEQRASFDWHALEGEPCPHGLVDDLGTIAFWSRNPLKRAAWRIAQFWASISKHRKAATP